LAEFQQTASLQDFAFLFENDKSQRRTEEKMSELQHFGRVCGFVPAKLENFLQTLQTHVFLFKLVCEKRMFFSPKFSVFFSCKPALFDL